MVQTRSHCRKACTLSPQAVPEFECHAMEQFIHALTVLFQPSARIAEETRTFPDPGAREFQRSVHAPDQASLQGSDALPDRVLAFHHHFRSCGRRRGAQICGEICYRIVRLVPDRGDDRYRGGINRPCNRFLVEGPEVFKGAAAAARDHDIDIPFGNKINDPAKDDNYTRTHQEPRTQEPSSDQNTIRETGDFAIKLGLDTMQIMPLTPLPGTPLLDEMRESNRLLHTDWSKYDVQHVVFKPLLMTPAVLQIEAFKAMARFYSWKYILRCLTQLDFKYAAIGLFGKRIVDKALKAATPYLESLGLQRPETPSL